MYPTARFPEFIMDAASAVAWVYKNINTYGKCDEFYVGGSFAGGYLSMMLCFDPKYLSPHGISPTDLNGFVHDAGQPTSHFNILRERGIDSRRVIVDETAPLFHVGRNTSYPPMLFIVSDNDMQNRYEQTLLMMSTLKHFEHSNATLKIMNGEHCQYVSQIDENSNSVFGKIVFDFINKNR